VVDTSVAHSAGGERATHPTSKNCRSFLKTMLEHEHRLVMTPAIMDEWRRHQSRYARAWLVQMFARRRVDRIPSDGRSDLHPTILSEVEIRGDGRCLDAVRKDLILIDPALATDRLIVSLDETVRECFARAARSVGELRVLVWVCPANQADGALEWLQAGAVSETHRRLGHRSE
jgi:hypothetical protein